MSVQSQSTFLLQGQVLNDSIERASLNVVNISLRKGAITNANGQFEIKARLNDTLHISAVQYEPKQFVVTQKMEKDKSVSFYLIPKITELDEVILSNINLSGDLSKDIGSLLLKKEYIPSDFGFLGKSAPKRTSEERMYYAMTGGAGGFGALINLINGNTKKYKRQLEISKFQLKVERNRVKFSDSMYVRNLKVPQALIEDFVFYALEDTVAVDAVNLSDKFALWNYFTTKVDAYLRIKRGEGVQVDPE
tara:strand:+ start:576 stop:1322 length:747 start_codon:yes stop_codon:yes gene_type:complete